MPIYVDKADDKDAYMILLVQEKQKDQEKRRRECIWPRKEEAVQIWNRRDGYKEHRQDERILYLELLETDIENDKCDSNDEHCVKLYPEVERLYESERYDDEIKEKIIVDKIADGGLSPNRADSVMIAFAPTPPARRSAFYD